MDINLPRAVLEQAAFWDQGVCLDCGTIQTCDPLAQPPTQCEECDSEAVYSAAFILRCADFVDPLDDGS